MQSGILQGQMNALSARIILDISSEREEYLTALAALEQRIMNAMETQSNALLSTITPVTQTANVTSSLVIETKILKVLKEIKESLKDSKPGRSKGKPTRTDTSKYCWTHSACGHDSASCRKRKEGHQMDAMFDDKKGGSTAYCRAACG